MDCLCFLPVAALHAFSMPTAALGLSGTSIIQALVAREQARLDNAGIAAGLGPKGASRIVALATVRGAIDADLLRQLADPALEIGLPSSHQVVDTVQSLYLWSGNCVTAPEPDIVAAALLLKILGERPDKAPEWLWLMIKNTNPPVLIDRLGRVVLDTTLLTQSSDDPISGYLSRMIADDPDRAARLEFLTAEDNLPLSLAGFAADVDRSLANCATETNISR
jgi:hypothetical protein